MKKVSLSSYPYTMKDLRKAAGMTPNSFRVWKTKNNVSLARVRNGAIVDPKNHRQKRFSKEYHDRIVKLRSSVPTRKPRVAPKSLDFVVSVPTGERGVLRTLTKALGWTIAQKYAK